MSRNRLNQLLPVGLLLLGGGLMLHIWTKGDHLESVAGFLIGVSIVFIIAGSARQWRGATH